MRGSKPRRTDVNLFYQLTSTETRKKIYPPRNMPIRRNRATRRANSRKNSRKNSRSNSRKNSRSNSRRNRMYRQRGGDWLNPMTWGKTDLSGATPGTAAPATATAAPATAAPAASTSIFGGLFGGSAEPAAEHPPMPGAPAPVPMPAAPGMPPVPGAPMPAPMPMPAPGGAPGVPVAPGPPMPVPMAGRRRRRQSAGRRRSARRH